MIKVDYYSTVTLIEDSLINDASPQELVLESLLMNVYTKNLNEGMESTLSSFADSNTGERLICWRVEMLFRWTTTS